jgi:2-haloacid dehalogenase
MTTALAFDIYGTLIDPHGVVNELQKMLGQQAAEFSRLWRDKQLEYTWRRSLMRRYEDFGVCTRQALDYADQVLGTGFDEDTKSSLMKAYRVLPAYPDVPAALEQLQQAGYKLYPFSNGTADMVAAVLEHAGIDRFFEDIISVDSLRTFKPSPEVYQYVIDYTGAGAENCWLVSSNGFDVMGAISAGMKAAWLRRFDGVVFDPWGIEPTAVIDGLDKLPAVIAGAG